MSDYKSDDGHSSLYHQFRAISICGGATGWPGQKEPSTFIPGSAGVGGGSVSGVCAPERKLAHGG